MCFLPPGRRSTTRSRAVRYFCRLGLKDPLYKNLAPHLELQVFPTPFNTTFGNARNVNSKPIIVFFPHFPNAYEVHSTKSAW